MEDTKELHPTPSSVEGKHNTAFVSMETEADMVKRRNLYLASACI